MRVPGLVCLAPYRYYTLYCVLFKTLGENHFSPKLKHFFNNTGTVRLLVSVVTAIKSMAAVELHSLWLESRQSLPIWASGYIMRHLPRLLRFLLLQRRLQELCSSRLKAFAVERAIAADPDLSLLGRLAASQQPAAPAAAGPQIPCRYPATLSYENPL